MRSGTSIRPRTTHRIPMFERLDPVVYAPAGETPAGPLSAEDLERFERDGFLFYEGLLPADEVRHYREEPTRLLQDPSLLDEECVLREPRSNEVRSIFRVHRISPLLAALGRDRRFVEPVRQILGSDVYIHQSRINYKPGFEGKGFNWHSDFETWHAEDGMPRMRAVRCSIILTDNNEFNGPLMLVPGSHRYFVPCVGATPDDNYKSSLKDQQIGVPDRESLAELIERGGIRAPKGPAGSVLFFDCNTLHGSNANMSPFPRSNAFFVYNSIDNRLQAPYAARRRRPLFLTDDDCRPIRPR